MKCQNCGSKVEDWAIFCDHCGKSTRTNDTKEEISWTKVKGNGEKYSSRCGVCGRPIFGHAWSAASAKKEKGLRVSEQLLKWPGSLQGITCGTCGFTVCWMRHHQELKHYGAHLLQLGECPQCGAPLSGDNMRCICYGDVETDNETQEKCVFCGSTDDVRDVRIWSGEIYDEAMMSAAYPHMGLAAQIHSGNAGTVSDIQVHNFRVCKACENEKRPEDVAVKYRRKRANFADKLAVFIAQDEPFKQDK